VPPQRQACQRGRGSSRVRGWGAPPEQPTTRRTEDRTARPVYKTESGTIFRVLEGPEGHLEVEFLQARAWQAAPIGMAGLRIARGTKRLTVRQVEALPE
jgi:hypothetical protein